MIDRYYVFTTIPGLFRSKVLASYRADHGVVEGRVWVHFWNGASEAKVAALVKAAVLRDVAEQRARRLKERAYTNIEGPL